jgi:hypothetical protein
MRISLVCVRKSEEKLKSKILGKLKLDLLI